MLFLFVGNAIAKKKKKPILSFKDGDPNTLVLRVAALDNPVQVVMQTHKGDLLFTETLVKGYRYSKTYDISTFLNSIYFIKLVSSESTMFFRIEIGAERKIYRIDSFPFQ